MKKFVLSLSVSGLLIAAASVTRADNWPQWRGPSSDGVSREKNIPTQWSKSDKIAWRTPMPGQAGATPCVWNDRVFVTSSDGDDLVLLCVDAKDGKILWRNKVGTGNTDARAGEGNSASPSPCTDGKHVWVFYGTGLLACYDFQGQEIWKFDVGDRFGRLDIQFGMTSTPVLDGDHLYLQLIHGKMKMDDDTRTGKIIKLAKDTGETVWEIDRATDAKFECKHSYASPFVYSAAGKRFLVVHGADCITGHALDNGAELWRFGMLNGPTEINPKQTDPTFRFVASPGLVPNADTIIVPTAKEGPTVSLRVSSLVGDSSKSKQALRWNSQRTPDVSIPLVVDGLVYLLNKDGRLQCLELESGKEVYFSRTYPGQHRTSPTYADGHIYFGSNDGHFTVVRAGREFEMVSCIDMGEAITASAVIANGTLFIRSYEALYAIRN